MSSSKNIKSLPKFPYGLTLIFFIVIGVLVAIVFIAPMVLKPPTIHIENRLPVKVEIVLEGILGSDNQKPSSQSHYRIPLNSGEVHLLPYNQSQSLLFTVQANTESGEKYQWAGSIAPNNKLAIFVVEPGRIDIVVSD